MGVRAAADSGVLRYNPVSEWEVSERIAHEPLVDDETFVAVQAMRVAGPAKDGEVRRYLLAGLVVCGLCGRRMDGHWVHGRSGYRCRHGFTSANRRADGEPRNLYVREDRLLEALPPYRSGTSFDIGMRVSVNGTLLGEDRLHNMHWSFGEMIAHARRGTWVRPGDIIGSGTCGNDCLAEFRGRGKPLPPLQPGDIVEMTVDQLGATSNIIVGG